MKRFAGICFALLSTSAFAGQSTDCPRADRELLLCPLPQAPRITELRQGTVLVQLSIAPDGQVTSARIVSATGHPAWKEAILQAVKEWRYKATGKTSTATVPFEMLFAR